MRLGVIAGTGAAFYPLPDAEERAVSTRWGAPSAPLLCWKEANTEFVLLRRHGAEGDIPPHAINYQANIAALLEVGIQTVVATNAVGGISVEASPGRLVVPQQLIDYTWGRAHSFFTGAGDEPAYADFTEPYTPELRARLLAAAHEAGVDCVDGGIVGVTQGPRLETAAEIDRLERDGCSIVGMTSMPEAGLAREAGMDYAACCSVVNFAAGRSEVPIHAEIEAHARQGMEQTARLLARFAGSTAPR